MNFNLSAQSFNGLIKETYKHLESQEKEGEQILADLWQSIPYNQFLSNPSNGFQMRRLCDAFATEGKSTKLIQLLHTVQQLFTRGFFQDVIAEQHLLAVASAELENQSLYAAIADSYEAVKDKIRLRTLFQLLSDDWGRERSNLQGRGWEGDQPSFLLDYLITFATKLSIPLHTQKLLDRYRFTFSISQCLEKVKNGNDMRKIADRLILRAKELKPGESFEISGGWGGLPSNTYSPRHIGHAITYQLLHLDEGRYAFNILNSGSGLPFHGAGKDCDHFHPALEWSGLSLATIAQSEFWEAMLEPLVIPSLLKDQRPFYDEDYIYSTAQKFLQRESARPHPLTDLSDIQTQRAGTCSRKSVDLIARLHLSEKEYKIARIEHRIISLIYLSLLIREGVLSPSERQFALENYEKGTRKLWGSMGKFVEKFGTDASEEIYPFIATLREMKQRSRDQELKGKKLTLPTQKASFCQFPPKVKDEIEEWSKAMAQSGLPKVFASNEISLPRLTLPAVQQWDDSSLNDVLRQLRAINYAAGKIMDSGCSEIVVAYLEESLFSILPSPNGEGTSLWQKRGGISSALVESLLQELYKAVIVSYNATHWMETTLPRQLLSFWKCYAIATALLRLDSTLDIGTHPVSWSHYHTLYQHPTFSLFTEDLACEARVLYQFFSSDSPGGKNLVGNSDFWSDEKWSSVALFDYSWEKGKTHLVGLIPENKKFGNYSRRTYEKRFDRFKRRANTQAGKNLQEKGGHCPDVSITFWQQLALFAQRGSCRKILSKDYKAYSSSLHDYPYYNIEIASVLDDSVVKLPSGFNKEIFYNVVSPNLALWPLSQKLLPFGSYFLKNMQLLQGEVVRDKYAINSLSTEENYALEMISTCPPELMPHLLLAHFEVAPEQLRQKEYLDYFTAHLHARSNVADAVKREPAFFSRLLSFLEKMAHDDREEVTCRGSVNRLLYTLYSLSRLYQSSQTLSPHQRKEIFATLKKVREPLLLLKLRQREWSGLIASFLLASYSIAPCDLPDCDNILNLVMKASLAPSTSSFEKMIRVEALKFVQSRLQVMKDHLNIPEARGRFLRELLLDGEEELVEAEFKKGACPVDLGAIVSGAYSQIEEWNAIQNEVIGLERIIERLEKTLQSDPGNADAKKYIEQHLNALEELKPGLPTLQQRMQLREQLIEELQSLPEKQWFWSGNILSIRNGDTFLEIDLLSGSLYRNGISCIEDALPQEVQKTNRCQVFGGALSGPAKLTPKGFILENQGFEKVLFKVNSNNDVLFCLEGKEYLLLDEEQKKACGLPQCFAKSLISLWAPTDTEEKRFILCSHDDVGAPHPLCYADKPGRWHLFSQPELLLCEKLPDDHLAMFGGLCCNSSEAIAWADESGEVVRVELPLAFEGEKITVFCKGSDGLWHWQERPSFHIASNQHVVELSHDALHLLLESKEGERILLMERALLANLFKRREAGEATVDVLQQKGQKLQGMALSLSKHGLEVKTLEERLYLIYRKLLYADYHGARGLLAKGVSPLGRSYNVDELMLIKGLIESHEEQGDLHSEACVLRLLIMSEVLEHLKSQPIDVKTLNGQMDEGLKKQLADFIEQWSPGSKYTSSSGYTQEKNRYKKIEKMYKAIARGTRPSDSITLESCFSTFSEREFISSVLREFNGKEIPYIKKRMKELERIPRVIEKGLPSPKEVVVKSLPKPRLYDLAFRTIFDTSIFGANIFSVDHQSLFPINGENDWETSFFSWADGGLSSYFRKAYRCALSNGKDPETISRKRRLRLFLEQRGADTEFQDRSARQLSDNRSFSNICHILLWLLEIEDTSSFPPLPPIDRYPMAAPELAENLQLRFKMLEEQKKEAEAFSVALTVAFKAEAEKVIQNRGLKQRIFPEKGADYDVIKEVENDFYKMKDFEEELRGALFCLDHPEMIKYPSVAIKLKIDQAEDFINETQNDLNNLLGVLENFDNIQELVGKYGFFSSLSNEVGSLAECQTAADVKKKIQEIQSKLDPLKELCTLVNGCFQEKLQQGAITTDETSVNRSYQSNKTRKDNEDYKNKIWGPIPPAVAETLKTWEGLQPIKEEEQMRVAELKEELTITCFASLQEAVKIEPYVEPYSRGVSTKLLIEPEILAKLPERERKAIQSVEADLSAYRKNCQEDKLFRLKKGKKEELASKTEELCKTLEQKSASLEGEILALANTLPMTKVESLALMLREQGSIHTVLDIDSCIGLALRNTQDLWKAKCFLNDEEIRRLQAKVIAYLYLQTEKQHLQRGLALLSGAASTDEELGSWLTCQRSYTIEAISNGRKLHELVFEYYADMRIRTEQSELIDKLGCLPSRSKAQGIALQLVMGAGKTKLIGPILAAQAADGERLSTYCFPNSLYDTGSADLSELLYKLFKIRTWPLQFSRRKCTVENLHRIVVGLEKARREGAVVLHKAKDLHCLNLMYQERQELIFRGQGSQKMLERYENEIELLKQILLFLEKRQEAQFDEFDTTFNRKNQVSFPIGPPKPVSPIAIKCACDLYFSFLPKYDHLLHISSNQQTLTSQDALNIVLNELAKDLWTRYQGRFQGRDKGFIDYLYNRKTSESIKFFEMLQKLTCSKSPLDQRIPEELAFWKHIFSKEGIAMALQADGHVAYDLSQKERNFELVIPCEHKGVPKEGTRFKSPWEALLKTCQFYRHTFNNPSQTARLIASALGFVESEKERYKEALQALFGNLEELDTRDEEKLACYTTILFSSLAGREGDLMQGHALFLISSYLETVVFPTQQMRDPVQMTSAPSDLAVIPARPKGFSGTWAYAHSWPLRFTATPTLYTDAMTIDALLEEQNQRCIIAPEQKNKEGRQEFLDVMIKDEEFALASAIIDVGPLLKEDKNEETARKLLSYFESEDVKRQGVNKKAVVFYKQNSDGTSSLALMKNAKSTPVLLRDTSKETLEQALGKITFDELFTLYDHAHTVGSDIFQRKGAKAYLFFGDQVTKDQLLQAVARMRALIARGHSITSILSESVAQIISKRLCKNAEELQMRDLICFASIFQEEKERPIYGYSLRENLYSILKEAIRQKQLTATPKERQEIFEKFRPHLLTVQKETLFEELGHFEEEKVAQEVLNNEIGQIGALLKELGCDMSQELENIVKNALKTIPLPDKLSSRREISEGAVEIEEASETEEELEHHKLTEVHLELDKEELIPAKEKAWPEELHQEGIFDPVEKGGSRESIPALYRLEECHSAFSGLFSKDLLVSENYLKTFENNTNSLLTDQQRGIHHLLVVRKDGGKERIVLLTTAESLFFLKKLAQDKPDFLCLIEPSGELVQSGKGPLEIREQLLTEALFAAGDAKRLSQEPHLSRLIKWKRSSQLDLRGTFEKILELYPDSLNHYLATPSLQRALT